MNINEFAKKLDGRHEGREITKQEENKAKELGFVVVFAYSDDNAEFRGAIDDEVGCFNGGEIYIDANGIFKECQDDCKYSRTAKEKCRMIEALWHDDGEYAWTYETDIQHAIFDILDEEENKWCKGIVFDIKSL